MSNLDLANKARQDKALDKLYRFNGIVSTFREEVLSKVVKQ